jgi:DNA-binding LacI/PurR family transcriptional regulator
MTSHANPHARSRPERRAKQIWHLDVVRDLRAKILDGTFAPGQQLPTYHELEQQFGGTPRTIARALAVLQEHGFVRTEKRRGIFVEDQLPHRSHFALVIARRQDDPHLSQFQRALANEARNFEDPERRITAFYGVADHTASEDYQQLAALVRSHRLAGLIFAQAVHEVEGLPPMEEPGIPRVVIASDSGRPDVPVVCPGPGTFLPKALDYLAARGRKRVALIRLADDCPWPPPEVDEFMAGVAERGMTTRRCWVQSVSQLAPQRGNETAQLLMFAPPEERPDALIIRDDNLVEHATAGLVEAGVRVGQDIDVVAHANFPWVTRSATPVCRLGYDIHQLFETCIDRLDTLRRGQQVTRVTYLPAYFEDELAVPSVAVET